MSFVGRNNCRQSERVVDAEHKVRDFRKTVEEGRRLLYRQYSHEAEWEELLMEHLVAFLNGRKRIDLESAVDRIAPLRGVMSGWFYWQTMYEVGTVSRVNFDFDGDDEDEKVTFRFQQMRHWLTFEKKGSGYEVAMSDGFVECLQGSGRIHLAVKDVNNDGIPELLIAADRGDASAMLGIYGVKDGTFAEIVALSGQRRMYVYENGHIVMPYGSVGLSSDYGWKDGAFTREEGFDPLRRLSAF